MPGVRHHRVLASWPGRLFLTGVRSAGELTRTRRRRSFCAARQHDLEKVRFLRKIQLQRAPHPVSRLVITLEVVAAAAGPLGWKGEAGDHG